MSFNFHVELHLFISHHHGLGWKFGKLNESILGESVDLEKWYQSSLYTVWNWVEECYHFIFAKLPCFDFPDGSDGKASAYNVGDPEVGKILWRRKWQPTPVLLPGKSHGWRSVIGYSPWGHKELDTTERLHFHFHHPLKQDPEKEISHLGC